jgi:ribosome-binding protein aMBF1 (putative translation factor)
MDDQAAGKIIRQAREQSDLTQADLGEVLHLSQQSISDREKGRTGFKLSEVMQLQSVLKVKLFD